jgi:hypothetical protein
MVGADGAAYAGTGDAVVVIDVVALGSAVPIFWAAAGARADKAKTARQATPAINAARKCVLTSGRAKASGPSNTLYKITSPQ